MKTVMITGATSGFGKAMAQAFAREEFRLIVTGRRKDRLDLLVSELTGEGKAKAAALAFDVRVQKDVEEAVNSLPADWKNIDVLINNAGLALGKSTLENGDPEDWDGMIDTNVKGVLYTTRTVLPLLKNSSSPHIVNVGSIAGTEVYPGGNVYCASKHAVNALSKSMRQELLPYGIRVTQIRPGLAETEFSLVRYKGDAEKASRVYDGYDPLLAEDIARIACFAVQSPARVCINDIEVTPTAQANAFMIHRND
ncbi:MAG: SDR family NAD(P)-dependent oxidoreductase [Cryomorphaceae bacterium]|nr:SDR family NAD(P)-dependent oxidoreductase [Flavobacteriales bacterium]